MREGADRFVRRFTLTSASHGVAARERRPDSPSAVGLSSRYLFRGGERLPEPLDCGVDPTDDALGRDRFVAGSAPPSIDRVTPPVSLRRRETGELVLDASDADGDDVAARVPRRCSHQGARRLATRLRAPPSGGGGRRRTGSMLRRTPNARRSSPLVENLATSRLATRRGRLSRAASAEASANSRPRSPAPSRPPARRYPS